MATSRVTVSFPRPVEQVWHTVTDLAHTAWRSDLARVEVLDENHFVEHTRGGCATHYLAQMEARRAILDALLAGYNDGRRKTLFNTAVCLLPLEDLQSVMAALNTQPKLAAQPIRERAVAAAELLREAADRRDVTLKRNKKPKGG